jgi:hypothetical protein
MENKNPLSPLTEAKKYKYMSSTYNTPFSDIRPVVWRVLILVWAIFCGIMWLLFGRESSAVFVLVVVSLFAAMYFLLPYTLSTLASSIKGEEPEPAAKNEVKTFSGTLSATEASIQILLIPVTLTAAMGIAAIVALFVF